MHRYIGGANIDRFLGLLERGDLTPRNRSTITKLLIEEEDKLGRDLEHLDFAEIRAAAGRDRVIHVRNLRDALVFGTPEREQADRLLVNLENLQTLLEDFCHGLRDRVASRGL